MRIIIANQNETVRKTSDSPLALATIGLMSCVALILTDSFGNSSLTHVDSHTDLNFITGELQYLKDRATEEQRPFSLERCTITIIQPKIKGTEGFPSDLTEKVKAKLAELGLEALPALKDKRVRYTTEHTALMDEDKIFQPSMKDFIELFNKDFIPDSIISADNSLKKYTIESCAADPVKTQGDIYITQLNALFSERLPKLAYDNNEWDHSPTQLLACTKNFFYQRSIKDILKNIDSILTAYCSQSNGFFSTFNMTQYDSMKTVLLHILPGIERNFNDQTYLSKRTANFDARWLQEISFFADKITPTPKEAATLKK